MANLIVPFTATWRFLYCKFFTFPSLNTPSTPVWISGPRTWNIPWYVSISYKIVAGSSKCSTKPLSYLLRKLLTNIKQGLQKYCETAFSRSGINQMWILNNSKELLEHLKSPYFNRITSIKSFDFFIIYTTIPHQTLKSRLATIIRNSFSHKNWHRSYNVWC